MIRGKAWTVSATLIALVIGMSIACGSPAPTQPTTRPTTGAVTVEQVKALKGDAARGKKVYDDQGCAVCHMIAGKGATVGPDQTKIATIAATRKPSTSAEDYILESLFNPDAFVVSGYPAGTMPTDFPQKLSAQELADLLAYLMTLK